MEELNVFFCRFDIFSGCQASKGFHYLGNIYIGRTAGGACFAGNTQPDGVTGQDFFLKTELYGPHDLAGTHIHGIGGRAAGGAFAALITLENFLPASAFHEASQITRWRWCNSINQF